MNSSQPEIFDLAIAQALGQVDHLLRRYTAGFPDDTTEAQFYQPRCHEGHPAGTNIGWTTGFWTGVLWLSHQLTESPEYRAAAEAQLPSYGERLKVRRQVDHHDLGFLYQPSCIAAWRLTGNEEARRIALDAADCLMERYLPQAGIIQAWGDLNDRKERGRIIIDCLMNLPLLHWASAETGRDHYRDAALRHAQRSRQYLVRPDASSFHTYHFDPDTGAPRHGSTHQGYADDSCWARGQAWGIYGFALNHRHAPELGLLDTAMRQADYFLAHLPRNRIAYWDLAFGEGSDEPWDSSASSIAACGLMELASQLPQGERRGHYQNEARLMLESLARHCGASLPSSGGLLRHGVYHKRGKLGVDEANLWGDYYYLEALARMRFGWTPWC